MIADRSLIQYMQDDAYALLIQCFIRNSERSGYILNSEVYDAISDILVKDLVFIAINKENGLTIEVPFCCLYPYEGEVVDICLDRNAYRRDDSKNLPVGVHDDRFVWRLKRPEENSPDIKPIKFISAYHTKEYCLVIETTADRKEYDFHRVLEITLSAVLIVLRLKNILLYLNMDQRLVIWIFISISSISLSN